LAIWIFIDVFWLIIFILLNTNRLKCFIMKVFPAIMMLFGLLMSAPITSQNGTDISDLLERLNQNHMGSVLEVFTLDELQRIREYYATNPENFLVSNKNPLINRKHASTQVVVPVRVVSIEPEDLSSLIDFGPSPLNQFEGAGFVRGNPVNQAGIIDNTNRLYLRGIHNNTYINQGVIGNVPSGEIITGVEVVPGRTDQLFGISTNGSNSSHLLRINQNTWQAETIGGNNGLVLPIALARDPNNNLVTLDIDNDGVYGINAVSGAVNFIGNVGYDANFGQGMAYDEGSGKILSAAYNAVVGDSELREINPNTGLSVSLGIINPGTLNQFGWISYYDEDTLSIPTNSQVAFSYAPNPVSNNLYLRANGILENASIFDPTGKALFEKSINLKDDRLDLSFLSSGIYLLKVEINGHIETVKLIKE
jgi:hypothetical protein